jgi:hypothetical protein
MADKAPFTDKEIDARREAGLKKLLGTPPKPHKGSKTDAAPQRARAKRVAQTSRDEK